jgi:hypothetical protein
MATPWEMMKQQPMATHWENRQNSGLRHKVLKVGRDNKQHNSTFSLNNCHCAECGTGQNLKSFQTWCSGK